MTVKGYRRSAKNLDRASWAAAAVEEFQAQTRADDEDAVSDLLCDLMHYCESSGASFDHELDRARSHFEVESEGLE